MSGRKPTRVARHSLRREITRELRRCTRDLIASRDSCVRLITEPDLHALRLAARHLGAVLDVCDEIAPDDPVLVQARAELRELLDLTGPLRDVQLRSLAIERAVDDAVLRAALLRTCAREQVSKQKSAALRLARLDLECVRQLADMAWDDTAPDVVRGALRRAVRNRRQKLRERIATVSPDDADSVHKARIALKRYGYLLRAFAPYAGRSIRARSKPVERLQRRLGSWHDARVMDDWLHDQSRKKTMSRWRAALHQVREQFAWCDEEQVLLVARLQRGSW
jgi:CHAD domain-containing protein